MTGKYITWVSSSTCYRCFVNSSERLVRVQFSFPLSSGGCIAFRFSHFFFFSFYAREEKHPRSNGPNNRLTTMDVYSESRLTINTITITVVHEKRITAVTCNHDHNRGYKIMFLIEFSRNYSIKPYVVYNLRLLLQIRLEHRSDDNTMRLECRLGWLVESYRRPMTSSKPARR